MRKAAASLPIRPWLTAVAALAAVAQAACSPEEGDPSAVVLDPAVLHAVEITVAEADLDQLATDLDDRVPCTVSYDGEVVAGAGIRQKGNALAALDDKPSFSVKLDETDDDAELHGLHKLLLNASKQDPTLYREQLGAAMFTLAGVPAARVAHARVSLNGDDLGIYVVVEGIDKRFLRSRFGADNDEGNLYEGPCCGDFVDDLLQLDLDDEEKDGRSRDDLAALASVILNTPDADLADALGERLDLDGFLTTHALEAILDHWDGYSYRLNNYYLYDNPADGRFVFLPHGMDRLLQDPSFDPESKPLARLPLRIHAIPGLEARFHAELVRLVPAVWDASDALGGLDRLAELLHSAEVDGAAADDVALFDEHAGELRDALMLRRALLDPAVVCGDGKPQGLETCDDGNTAAGDGCSARCREEP